MYEVPLESLPNQSLIVNINGISLEITVNTAKDLTFLSIEGGDISRYSAICFPNTKVFIPNLSGAFAFNCQDLEYPDYRKFGDLHKLYYITEEKLSGN